MSFPKLNDIVEAVKSDIGNPMESVTGGDNAPPPASAPGSAPEAPAPAAASGGAPEAPTSIQQAILDLKELSKDKKFKLGDEELTLEDLEKGRMRWKDYTKKTQELSGVKKEYESLKSENQYWTALPGDLEKVKANPQLVAEFKKVYPEKFHSYVAELEAQQPLTEDRIRQLVQESIKPVVTPLQESITDQNAKAMVAQMEAWDSELKSKHKDADIDHVYTLIEKAKSEGLPISKDLWEQAWRQSNDYFSSIVNQRVQERFQEKQTLNQAGKDTKAGGATPGQAPEKWGLKDASKRLAEFLQSAN